MAASFTTFVPRVPPKKSAGSGVLLLRPSAPSPHRPIDAAREHWPADEFHSKRLERVSAKPCSSEVYIG